MPALCLAPVIDLRMRGMCRVPYPGHSAGCPNFGKKLGCPPQVPQVQDVFNLARPTYFIYERFDLGAHVAKMKAAHPDWSQRQLVCCLYWQGTARRALSLEIGNLWPAFDLDPGELIVNRCPEALGVDVTATMRQAGVILQWPPTTETIHVAMAGWPKGAS